MDIKPDTFGQQVSALARAEDRTAGGLGTEVSRAARSDKQLLPAGHNRNEAILSASLKVSIAAGNQPMETLYRSVIGELETALATDLGDGAIQSAYAEQLDVSAPATASRILSGSTAFFESFRARHPDLSEADARLSFTDLVRSGINEGFEQARGILDGLGVLEGEIASALERTYSLVMQGLEAFRTPSLAVTE